MGLRQQLFISWKGNLSVFHSGFGSPKVHPAGQPGWHEKVVFLQYLGFPAKSSSRVFSG